MTEKLNMRTDIRYLADIGLFVVPDHLTYMIIFLIFSIILLTNKCLWVKILKVRDRVDHV